MGTVSNQPNALRRALFLDAAASGGMGLLLLVAAGPLAGLLGLPLSLLRSVGVFLVPFAAMLFGLAGLPEEDADYTFKEVEGFESIEAYGKYTDVYTGGGFLRAEELFGRLLECNSARVYALNRVRLAEAP